MVTGNITVYVNICSVWVELGWEEFKGVERGMAGIPALANLFIDSRLLQELRSVSWLPK